VILPPARYPDREKLRAVQQTLSSELTELPGGASASLASVAPLDWDGPLYEFQIAGRETAGIERAPQARGTSVSPNYFSTLGLKIVAGRGLTPADNAGSQPVVVVTRALAETYFAGVDPVGQRIRLSGPSIGDDAAGGAREIVGVVSDVKLFDGLLPPREEPRFYQPLAQQATRTLDIVVRAGSDGPLLAGALRERVRSVDPLLQLARIETMGDRFERRLWQSTFFIRLMSILGGLALIVAAVGVYGVVSFATARRTREFAIRAALGAEPRQIAALVARQALALAGSGIALGLLLALLFGRAAERLLYDLSQPDAVTLTGIAALLGGITLCAAAVPCLRAARSNPADCLMVD
jgi:predicted lysophospholipase L1 biosynthesis ABC-type transport system permease subunit